MYSQHEDDGLGPAQSEAATGFGAVWMILVGYLLFVFNFDPSVLKGDVNDYAYVELERYEALLAAEAALDECSNEKSLLVSKIEGIEATSSKPTDNNNPVSISWLADALVYDHDGESEQFYSLDDLEFRFRSHPVPTATPIILTLGDEKSIRQQNDLRRMLNTVLSERNGASPDLRIR